MAILLMLTIGGSISTTRIPPAFASLQNPGQVSVKHDTSALATFYNSTTTYIGQTKFSNASFLLATFSFVNIAPAVNATAQAANSDLAIVNASSAQAIIVFGEAQRAISLKEYINATALISQGCSLAGSANTSLADFRGHQTARFQAESIPTSQYSKGSDLAQAEVASLLAECNSLQKQLNSTGSVPILLIGSPQTAIVTGGTVKLVGNLTLKGSGVPHQDVLFYINGSYFGTIHADAQGNLGGTLRIPFLYAPIAVVQAYVASNKTAGTGSAYSNILVFQILFNQTSIVVGDPPAVLPTFSFNVEGNLTTTVGTPLPNAPVDVTFFSQSKVIHTDAQGVFSTRLTVPANATDGIYYVYARFAPQGVFGPSINFTSVQVVHLPMQISFNAPPLWYAGVSTTLHGSARSNGSALADATIRVHTPWGSVSTTTDGSGSFKVNVPVSEFEFAFSRNITVAGTAVQPYVAPGAVTRSVGLFNFLIVIIPAAAIGLVAYEADGLGVFQRLKRGKGRQAVALQESGAPVEGGPSAELLAQVPDLLAAYRRALQLASGKLALRFGRSQTIREIVAQVGRVETVGEGASFRLVMLTVEDYLYAQNFDPARVLDAKAAVSRLEEAWK